MARTLADVKAYLGATSATDAAISAAMLAEASAQGAVVQARYLTGVESVDEAFKRRVARNLAMRGQALAVLPGVDGDSATYIPGRDPEIRRLEAPYRRLVIG